MAGFLRRKTNKDSDVLKQVPSSPMPLAATAPPPPPPHTPLFARFATSVKSSNDIPPTQRIVSSPMVLGRKELVTSHVTKRRTTQNQVQVLNKALPSIQPARSDHHLPPPADKPLPPPSLLPLSAATPDPSGSTPTKPWMKQSRPPHSTFQIQPQGRTRASLDNVGTKQQQSSKPPPSQSFYSAQPPPSSNIDPQSLISNQASRLPTTNNAPLTSPPRRNSAVSNTTISTNFKPQILPSTTTTNHKMQPNSLASFGRPTTTTTTITAAQSQNQTQHPSQRSVANQDLHPVNINSNMSMIGATSSKRIDIQPSLADTQGTPISDRGIDLPPEFALFQEFSQFTLDDRNSIYYSPRQTPLNIVNHNEPVPPSSVPRSSTYSDSQTITPRPTTILLGPSQENLLHPQSQSQSKPQLPPTPPTSSRPPTPPPPSKKTGMGVASSSQAIGNDLVPSSSSVKDFSSPRGILTNRTSSHNPANQLQMLNRRDHSNSSPLPPKTAPHLPHSEFPVGFSARSELSSNRITQVPRRPSIQEFQQPVHNLQSSGSSRKSVVNPQQQQGPTVPMKGKPRIFAAMAAQEVELDQFNMGFQPPPGLPQHVQPVVKKRPSQQSIMHTHQQQQQQQPTIPESNAYTNGSDAVKADLRGFSTAPQPPPTPKIANHVLEQLPPTPPSHSTSRSSRSRDPQSQQTPQTPCRARRLSKPRTPIAVAEVVSSVHHHHSNGSTTTIPGTPESYHRGTTNGSVRTLTKSRPTTPVAKPLFLASPLPPPKHEPPPVQLDEDMVSLNVGVPLDDDPFASVEGVTLLKPSNSLKEKEKEEGDGNGGGKKHRNKQSSQGLSISSQQNSLEEGSGKNEKKNTATVTIESETLSAVVEIVTPPTPISPQKTKKKEEQEQEQDDNDNVDDQSETTPAPPPPPPPPVDGENTNADADADAEAEPDEPEPEPIPQITMAQFLSDPQLLSSLLTFFSFYDWCILLSLSKEIRTLLVRTPELREAILERFLRTVGYSRWIWDGSDPLSLSLQDLNDYMRGVSTPTHEYARVAGMYVHSLTVHPNHRDPSLLDTIRVLTNSTRAYTRVVLRLRAQAEKEASLVQQSRITKLPPNFNSPSLARGGGTNSRVSSRAPSPTTSSYSHSHSYSHYNNNGYAQQNPSSSSSLSQTNNSNNSPSSSFRSPLFRLRRAPLLRVFVPSPEGDWLSDKSVLACEAECRRAGVLHLMRVGDVVWDVAVGDEGNVGRLVWDGSYLIDLDYTYTSIGDLPKYMPALAFPPSYFHRVIRTGPIVSNPVVHIDISPWGEEIAINLQLLQDRVRTETPQGAYHNVVRWVHRSYFVIRPPRGVGPTATAGYIHQGGNNNNRTQLLPSPRIPIPDTDNNFFVDPGWYGTIVVETEGTNEALADLQERCGPGAFPPRTRGVVVHHHHQTNLAQMENKKVFRILREKSRPNEIWIKAVGIKERLL